MTPNWTVLWIVKYSFFILIHFNKFKHSSKLRYSKCGISLRKSWRRFTDNPQKVYEWKSSCDRRSAKSWSSFKSRPVLEKIGELELPHLCVMQSRISHAKFCRVNNLNISLFSYLFISTSYLISWFKSCKRKLKTLCFKSFCAPQSRCSWHVPSNISLRTHIAIQEIHKPNAYRFIDLYLLMSKYMHLGVE